MRVTIIAAAPGVNSAEDVTEAHLAAITHLNLNSEKITTLTEGDFDGLSELTSLGLSNNQLTEPPTYEWLVKTNRD